MNKLHKIIYILILQASLSGCYDLDRYPMDKPSSGTFWQNDDQAKMGIMGVYSKMKSKNLYGILFGTDCLTDIGIGYDYAGYGAVSTGEYTDRTNYVVGKWKTGYDAVMAANNVIRSVSKSETITEETKNTVIGEAKFLRGLFYFHLLNYYGGVPLYDETVVLEKDYNNLMNLRSTEEETRAFILKDLTDAIEALPVSWNQSDYGRATKGAAYALRGKVYLYAKEYAKASSDFEEIVLKNNIYGYALYPKYAQLFKPKEMGGGDKSNEMIFAIQNLGGIGNKYGMPMGKFMGTRSSFGSCWNNCMPSTDLGEMYELKNGKKFNWDDFIAGFTSDNEIKKETFIATLSDDKKSIANYPKYYQKLLDMYKERDPRMGETLILPYTQYLGWLKNAPNRCLLAFAKGVHESKGFIRNNRGWHTYFWRKFVPEANMDGLITNREHTPINFPIIRYADVLLMLAECHNEMGKYDDAVNYINKVRQRPSTNLPALNSGATWLEARTKNDIFKRIMQERAVEFAAEGIRFNDIRRWRIAESLLGGKKECQLTGNFILKRSFIERDYLWPIPAKEREINPELKQNPGW